MRTRDLAVVGESFEDLIFASLPRLPRTGEEIKTNHFVRTIGGGAAITAIAARRAGATCEVVSGLSADADRRLVAQGIAVTNLRQPDEPHAVTAALSTRENRSFVTFTGVNAGLEPRLLRAVPGLAVRHVHFAFTPVRCARWRKLVLKLRRAGMTSSWDFGWNEQLPADPEFVALAESLDYLMMNEQEAPLFARRRELAPALAFWRRHARVTIVKLGSRGARWVSADADFTMPPPRVKVVDTTGAGDAFNGGFLAALLRGAPPRRAVAAGNRMGARSTRALGGIDGITD